ncbi:DUF1835 domain-containing protein [Roseomonas terrae]|uniref:DUF1835 domain-containing protein n=1 Tax=Neoroseomonas terrae TaxID=424799 RepID=A0ABS5ENR7_9PROT|nr:DUF1835 domain-containing protein [Neoroseomonas terrae]
MRDGDAEAQRRFRLHHPRAAQDDLLRLSEAQFVIARELGLPSWPKLKAHVEAMDRSWQRITQGEPAPDRDSATLHIRCGSDIGAALVEAGFTGDFLEYSDPFCQGPVTAAPGWLEQRVDFLTDAYGQGAGMTRETIAAKLAREEDGLASAAARYGRVVLWFEHDSYDQLILARCLSAFAEAPPRCLELISPAGYPGGTRFIGLGQLPPEALRLLWAERVPVSDCALRAGQAVWDALRAPDPRALAGIASTGTAALPQLGRAVRRHCQELPGTRDGLGLTQRLILQLVAEAPRRAGEVYSRLMMEREPLPWMTDLMFHDTVEAMRRAAEPVFSGSFEETEDRQWPQERLTATPLGRAVLAGEVDWMALRPPPRWVGGVFIPDAAPCWRWDEAMVAVTKA